MLNTHVPVDAGKAIELYLIGMGDQGEARLRSEASRSKPRRGEPWMYRWEPGRFPPSPFWPREDWRMWSGGGGAPSISAGVQIITFLLQRSVHLFLANLGDNGPAVH